MAFINGFLLCWYALTALSLLYLIYDQITNTPSHWVMSLAWALVILYTGPLGLFFYFVSCRQPFPGSHDKFIHAHWKQAFGSEIHCVAGDATAIIITAAVLHYFELPNGIEAIIEYCAAYLFGLLIFQALFMLTLFHNYWEAVRKTVFVETVSMNMVMAGMIPLILLFRTQYPITSDPTRPYFWGVMSLATFVAFLLAYPINSWMVAKGIKHGMMSRDTEHEHMHEMGSVSLGKQTSLVLRTYAFLIAVIYLCSFAVPVRFS
ncbi:MAG: DUF4396 domain-containing protein [Parachlamydiales bacterium]